MIQKKFLDKFNPNPIFPHGKVEALKAQLDFYHKFLARLDDPAKTSTDNSASTNTVTNFSYLDAMDMFVKKETSFRKEIKDILIIASFALTDEEFDNLDFFEYEEMFDLVVEANPRLVGFLYLKEKTKEETD